MARSADDIRSRLLDLAMSRLQDICHRHGVRVEDFSSSRRKTIVSRIMNKVSLGALAGELESTSPGEGRGGGREPIAAHAAPTKLLVKMNPAIALWGVLGFITGLAFVGVTIKLVNVWRTRPAVRAPRGKTPRPTPTRRARSSTEPTKATTSTRRVTASTGTAPTSTGAIAALPTPVTPPTSTPPVATVAPATVDPTAPPSPPLPPATRPATMTVTEAPTATAPPTEAPPPTEADTPEPPVTIELIELRLCPRADIFDPAYQKAKRTRAAIRKEIEEYIDKTRIFAQASNVYAHLAALYQLYGEAEEGLKAIEVALRIDKEWEGSNRAVGRLRRIYLTLASDARESALREVLRFEKDAAAVKALGPQGPHQLMELHLACGDLDAARKRFARLPAAVRRKPLFQLFEARLLIARREYVQAIAIMRKLEDKNALWLPLLDSLAKAYALAGDERRADEYTRMAARIRK